jgi:hypothetical protein
MNIDYNDMFFLMSISTTTLHYRRNPDLDIPVEKLRKGNSGTVFESDAAVCRGIQMTCSRKWFPWLYDERDFTRLVFLKQ